MSRRKEFFPEVTDQQWNDWHWQVKNRIETVDELKKYIKLTAYGHEIEMYTVEQGEKRDKRQ